MKKIVFFLFVLIQINSFSQNEKELVVKQIDSTISAKGYEAYYIDFSRKLHFNDIKNKAFSRDTITPVHSQAVTWYKLKISPEITSKYFIFSPVFTPKSEVYIPLKNGNYKTYKLGFLNTNKPIKNIALETTLLTLPTDSIGFTKPIFFSKYPIYKYGKNSIKEPAFFIFTNDKTKWLNEIIVKFSDLHIYQIIISIIFLSSLMFLLNFIVLNDKNFLNYSLYLFFTSLIFAPNFPIFFNFFNAIHRGLFEYVGAFAIPMTATLYFYFVTQFIQVNKQFPKIRKLVNITIYSSFIYAIYRVTQHVFLKFLPFRFYIDTVYNVLFLLSSITVFIYLINQKLSFLKRIVVLGSLLLIIGQILSLLLGQPLFFLFGVLLEIVVFSVVVTLQNKATVLNETQNLIALNNETEKRKNLIYLNKVKTNFITNLSHEFRTPLTLISAPLEQLTHQNLPKIVSKNISIIKRNTHRLIELSNQLLDISKLDEGRLQLTIVQQPIDTLIKNLITDFSYLAQQKSITVKTSININHQLVWIDKDILKKVLSNLLSNAIKYTPKKGYINIESTVEDGNFTFKIKNSGKGISKEDLLKVFERFHQIDINKQGAGIGLSLVNELIKIHKGKIEADSKINQWTCFNIQIPIDKINYINQIRKDNPKTTHLSDSFSLANQINEDIDKPVLLLIEDNKELCDFMEQLFSKEYIIIKAFDGKEGLNKALKYIPNIIISDIMMPVMDGISLSKKLTNHILTSHIPIILLTAKADHSDKLKGFASGVIDYITKPFSTEILQKKIKNILANQKALQKSFDKELFKTKEVPYSSLDKEFIVQINELLDDKLVEPSFTVQVFCEFLGMSRMQLHRKLKALTGLSASEFIRSQRLKLAIELLKKSDATISEIAYSVGYNDPAYFTKIFKQSFGCTPSNYLNKRG